MFKWEAKLCSYIEFSVMEATEQAKNASVNNLHFNMLADVILSLWTVHHWSVLGYLKIVRGGVQRLETTIDGEAVSLLRWNKPEVHAAEGSRLLKVSVFKVSCSACEHGYCQQYVVGESW